MESNFIKIPKDFQSLHDLKDLVDNFGVVLRLKKLLDSYQMEYLKSHVMTGPEVINYIPKNQHNDYQIIKNGRSLQRVWHDYDSDWTKISENDRTKQYTIRQSIIESYNIKAYSKRIYMVDTINKIIYMCPWVDAKHITNNETMWTGQIDFNVEPEKYITTVSAHYTFTDSQAIGGVWINGRENGYLSGETYNKYTRTGVETHKFCTRTNKYLGLHSIVESPERPWIEKTSRY